MQMPIYFGLKHFKKIMKLAVCLKGHRYTIADLLNGLLFFFIVKGFVVLFNFRLNIKKIQIGIQTYLLQKLSLLKPLKRNYQKGE